MKQNVKLQLKVFTLILIFVVMSIISFLSLDLVSLTGAAVADDAQISGEVQQAFDSGKEEVSVIVILADDVQADEVVDTLAQQDTKAVFGLTNEKEFELEQNYKTINAFAGKLTEEGLKELENNPAVEKIVINKIRHIFLSESVPLINGNDLWNISVDEQSITGTGQTVCVIDTGIDYNHTGLGGGFGNKVIAGHDFANNDSDPMDDNGHGTHVAGIIASSDSTYRGVAPDAKLVAMKVCNSGGSCEDADVLAGFDWCISNAETYNISVISISLGGGSYTSYCDESLDFAAYATMIDDAVSKDISVIAATGNAGANSVVYGIAGPACLQKSTRVTATTKADVLASYASRHSFFNDTISAPGSSITSLNKGGGTSTLSGTSMSTPHVSGAVVLMNQYWKMAYNKVPTPEQAEQKILASGLEVYDSLSNTTYPRVDVLAMLKPLLTFSSAPDVPADNAVLNTTYVQITVVSDVDLSSAVLEWAYPDGTTLNLSMDPEEDSTAQFSSSLGDLEKGLHAYRVYGTDAAGMVGVSEQRMLTVDNIPPDIILQAPADGMNLSDGQMTLSAIATDAHSSVAAVTFNVTGINVADDTNESNTLQLSGLGAGEIWNASLDVSALAEGRYTVVAYAYDSLDNKNESGTASFMVDKTGPVIVLLSPAANSTVNYSSVSFEYNVSDESTMVTGCSLYLNDTLNVTAVIDAADGYGSDIKSFNLTLLNSDYTWKVSCSDTTGNAANSSSYLLQVLVPEPVQDSTPTPPPPPEMNLSVTLDSPVSNYISSNTAVNFACSVAGSNQSNVTLYGNWSGWHAEETKPGAGVNSTANYTAKVNFTKTISEGVYVWNCLAADIYGNAAFASANNSFTIDQSEPSLTSITTNDIDENSAETLWVTDEVSNSTVQYGSSEALDSAISDDGEVTSHSVILYNLNSSTTYYYAATSCDKAGNCDTSDTSSFITAAEESSSDSSDDDSDSSAADSASSSSASSSSGGGGGSSSSSTAAEEESDAEILEEETLEAVPEAEEQPADAVSVYSHTVSLSNGQPGEITFAAADVPVTKIEISAAVDKEIVVSAVPLQLPADIPVVDGVYMYLDITATLEPEELDLAKVTFTVPLEWLKAHNYTQNSVVLRIYEDEQWDELDTNLVSEEGSVLTYQAEVPHFSYFAITAGEGGGFGSLITGLFSAVVPSDINAKEYVLYGLGALAMLLLIAYIFVTRMDKADLVMRP